MACVLSCSPVFAGEYDFIHYSKENGLVFNSVRAMAQDTRGVMWVGTYNGLNTYDGQRFRTYGAEDLKSKSAFISCLYAGPDGDVLIGTDDGLTIWDNTLSEFIRPEGFQQLSDRIFSMCGDSKGNIWIGTRFNGLYLYSDHKLTKVTLDETEYNSTTFYRMAIDRNDRMYVALYCKHIMYWDISEDNFRTHKLEVPSNPEIFDSDDVEGLSFNPNSGSILYVASKRNGLCELNLNTGTIKRLLMLEGDSRPVSMVSDRKYLWLSTTSGLIRYDFTTGQGTSIMHDTDDPFSLSGNHVTAVYANAKDKLWVGTEGRGLNIYEPSFKFFKKICKCSDGTSLKEARLTGFAEDKSGVIWFSTLNKGLFKYDRRSGTVTKADAINKAIPSMATICSEGDILWMGYQNGISKVDIGTGKIHSYPHFHNYGMELDNRVIDIKCTFEGDVFLGTAVGLMKYDRQADDFKFVEAVGQVAVDAMQVDERGTLWLATYSRGIIAYDPHTDSVTGSWCSKHDGGCVPETVQDIAIDPNGDIYGVGFQSGFAKYNAATGRFDGYDKKNVPGLNNDAFLSIMPDDEGSLWLSADLELIRYNMSTGTIRNFSDFPFLLGNGAAAAMFKCKDGTLLLGSDNGFLEFAPSSLKPVEDINSYVIIMELTAGGQVVRPSSQSILKKSIDITDAIRIPPGCNSFGFTFATPKKEQYERNDIYCRLEGYDEDWRNITSEMEVTYNNVPAGRYQLSVVTKVKDGTLIKLHDDISVEVREFFLNTVLGLLLIVFSTAVCATIVFVILYRRQRDKYRRQIAQYSDMISRSDREFLVRLEKIVSENLSNPNFGVLQLEESMCMSRSSLTRKMHALTGTSPVDYLRTKRLEKAAALLREGNKRVNEVCFAVGFKSHSYFTKCFKDKFGKFPTEYVLTNKN